MNKAVQMCSLFLDFLLPHRGARKTIETVDAEIFLARAARSDEYLGDNTLAALRYRDPLVRAAVWALKYHESRHASALLAEALHAELTEHLADRGPFEMAETYLLVPVPLSSARLRERGFNQATLLAKTLCTLHPELPLTFAEGILVRITDTPHQTKIRRRAERLANVVGCFAVSHPERIRGKNIIVLDDVTTTGATLAEARRVLLEAGAREVLALAVAH
jgi:ComF family protein